MPNQTGSMMTATRVSALKAISTTTKARNASEIYEEKGYKGILYLSFFRCSGCKLLRYFIWESKIIDHVQIAPNVAMLVTHVNTFAGTT